MTRLMASALAAAVLLTPSLASAQNPLMTSVKSQHDGVKSNLLKTAAAVPDAVWSYKATPEVRSFAQLVGHIIDASMSICGAATGDKGTPMNAEKTMTTKADLSKALADAMAFCDKQIASLDDTKGMEQVKFFGGMTPRAMVIAFNTSHSNEHYGNLVTYMRLNKIVPPSSAGTGN